MNKNIFQKCSSIFCADFTSLFTNLPHTEIKDNMRDLIIFCFSKNKDFIKVNYHNCRFSATHLGKGCYSQQDVIHMVDTVLDNSYAKFATVAFRQVKGIPMGGNASPEIADLTLTNMEYRYCSKKENENKIKDIKLASRYVDDLICINNKNIDFNLIAKEIYGTNLALEATHKSNKETNYLDLTIKLDQGIHYNLFNKTDDFSFDVIRYSNFKSNIPNNYKYNIISGETIRTARASSNKNNFKNAITNIQKILVQNNYLQQRIIKTTNNILEKHKYYSFL